MYFSLPYVYFITFPHACTTNQFQTLTLRAGHYIIIPKGKERAAGGVKIVILTPIRRLAVVRRKTPFFVKFLSDAHPRTNSFSLIIAIQINILPTQQPVIHLK